MAKKLGLYLHIPFCQSKCAYCDFYSVAGKEERRGPYIEALIQHMSEYGATAKNYLVDTVYIGGGTPSCLEPGELKKLLAAIKKSFALTPDAEITCEVNPKSGLKKVLKTLKKGGVNRLSIGVQSLDDGELSTIGRIHTAAEVAECVDEARKLGFANWNLDVIFALPGQTMESLERTLSGVLALGPRHVSCYSLTLAEGTPLYERRDSLDLPGDELDRAMYERCIKKLAEAGLEQYEISNFAVPGFESRHNLKYWNCEEYLGLGAGAHSYFGNKRFSFPADIDGYIDGVKNGTINAVDVMDVPPGERIGEYIMLKLRTNEGIRDEEFRRRFRVGFAEACGPAVEKFLRSGHLTLEEGRYFLSLEGMNLSNTIIAELLCSREEALCQS